MADPRPRTGRHSPSGALYVPMAGIKRTGSRAVRTGAAVSVEQADLAQDRDRVRVDVLALDQAVLEGDHVDAVPADRAARRRRLEIAAAHRLRMGGGRRPLLGDHALAHVEAPGLEPHVGPGREDPGDV